MNATSSPPRVAVDVGNTRLKLGMYAAAAAERPAGEPRLPELLDELTLPAAEGNLDEIAAWLCPHLPAQCNWWIGSVNRPASSRLVDWLRQHEAAARITLLCADDLPLEVRLPRPDMVGIDRLLAALAANHLRPAGSAAVVVCLGSAITVNLVTAEGAFAGGAILPGISMSARALHDYTDLLPLVEYAELAEPPAVVGDETRSAMRSGLFWGALGGIRELIARMTEGRPALVLVTGGAAASVAELIGSQAHFVPQLVLSGIALAAGPAAAGDERHAG